MTLDLCPLTLREPAEERRNLNRFSESEALRERPTEPAEEREDEEESNADRASRLSVEEWERSRPVTEHPSTGQGKEAPATPPPVCSEGPHWHRTDRDVNQRTDPEENNEC